MKANTFIRYLNACVVLAIVLSLCSVSTSGGGLQTLTWSGTTNNILTLNKPYPLGALADSGLPVALHVDHGPAVIVDGMITVSALGTVVVSATQAGDGEHPHAALTRSFNVRQVLVTPLGMYPLGRIGTDLEVLGGYAYFSERYGDIRVIDLSNPRRPALVRKNEMGTGVELAGDYAYVTGGHPGFDVLSISNPSNLTRIGGYAGNESLSNMRVKGKYAYAASSLSGLITFDVSNPQQPSKMGSYHVVDVRDFQVAGGYAYVATASSGFQVVSLADPTNPQLAGVLDLRAYTYGVEIAEGRAYLANGVNGLEIVDVNDPLNPARLGKFTGIGAAFEVKVSGDYAYVASGAAGGGSPSPFGPPVTPFEPAGLTVIDVSDPAKPVRVGGFESNEGYAYNSDAFLVRVVGDVAYLTGELGGLKILRLRMGYPQALEWKGATNLLLSLNQPYALSAASSSDLPVTLRVESGPAVLTNGELIATGLGTVVVSAEQAGDEAFLPALITRSFNVRQAVLTRVGSYGGTSEPGGIQLVGRYAYVADYIKGLEVIDVGNPSSPTRVGGYHPGGTAEDVQVVGNLAFVAAGVAGLQIIDVSNPANPTWVGGYETETNTPIESIQVVGRYAYTGKWQKRMLVIDVSNPASPQRIGNYDTESFIGGVKVVGDYAYVSASDNGLQIIDVSDPAHPVMIGNYSIGGDTSLIHVFGDFAYIANDVFGMGIFDIRNPANPTLVSWLPSLNHDIWGVQVFGGYAYGEGGNELEVYDVNDPTRPVSVGRFVTSWGADSVQVVGDYVYMPEYALGLQILRLDWGYPQTLTWTGTTNQFLSPGAPHPLGAQSSSGLPIIFRVESGPAILADGTITVTNVGTVVVSAEQAGNADFLPARETKSFNVPEARLTLVGSIDTSGSAEGVQVIGGYAYLADGTNGLRVIDVSDAAHPVAVSEYDLGGSAFSVQVVDDLAYVSVWAAGFRVIDVSSPLNPIEIGRHDSDAFAGAVQVAGKYAYMASWETGLEIFDVSNPTTPKQAGRYGADGPASQVQVVGNLAFLATITNGLQVVDLRNPANPTRVGQYVFDYFNLIFGVEIAGNYAYLSFSSSENRIVRGWMVVDVSNPDYLTPLGDHNTTEYAGVQVFGNYAFLRDEANSLVVYDVSTPAKPVRIGAYRQSNGSVSEVQVVGNHVYVADGTAGLQILEMRLGYPQTLERRLSGDVSFQPLAVNSLGVAKSGLPVAISVISGPAKVNNGQVVFTGVGPVVLRVEQGGDDFYLPVSAEWSVRITPPEIGVRLSAGETELYWAAGLEEFKLQVAESLTVGAQWVDVLTPPIERDGEVNVQLNHGEGQRFFRLEKH